MTGKSTLASGVEEDESISETQSRLEDLSVNCAEIRRNYGPQHRLEANDDSDIPSDVSGSLEPSSTECTASTIDNNYSLKPVVSDVKLIKKALLNTERAAKGCRLTCVNDVAILRSANDDLRKPRPSRTASTFGQAAHHNVYIGIGEYQTLLRPPTAPHQPEATADVTINHWSSLATVRHSTPLDDGGDPDDVMPASVTSRSIEEPQTPLVVYGEDTIRAITLITEKFDSFRRHQLKVRSFVHQCRSVSSSTRSRTAASIVGTESGRDGLASRRSKLLRMVDEHGFAFLASNFTSGLDDVGHVTATEIDRTWLFYSSVATEVVVCRSLADVSFGACATPSSGTGNGRPGRNDSTVACKGWVHVVTGIPTLVLNTGAICTRRRELLVVIADRQTGLPVWRDRVSYMSEYHEVTSGVHAMRVSGGLTKRVKLDIFDRSAADEFLASYRSMTSDPADELWKMSADDDNNNPNHSSRHHGNTNVRRGQRRRPSKSVLVKRGISQPCSPRWVTRVNINDSNFRSAFVDFLPAASKEPVNSDATAPNDARPAGVDEEFRPRLPTH